MDDCPAVMVQQGVEEVMVAQVEWEVSPEGGNAGVFSELLDPLSENPSLEEMEGHGVFVCTQHLISQFQSSTTPLSDPLEATSYFTPTPLPALHFPRQSLDLDDRPSLLPASRHSSPRLSPLAMVRKATRIRPKPSSRTQSTSDLPKAQLLLLPSSPSLAAAPSVARALRSASPLPGFVRMRRQSELSDGRVNRQSFETGSGGNIVVQDLSTTRKLKTSRSPPSTLRPDDLVAGPSYSKSMSAKPDTVSTTLSSPTHSPPDPRRRSWRTSLSSFSSPSTPSTPSFEHPISRTRSSSPVTEFPSSASRTLVLPPIEHRKAKRGSRSSSADSYNADGEGPSSKGRSRVMSASAALSKGKWAKALNLGWGARKAATGRQSLDEDTSDAWNWLDGDDAVEGKTKPSFEVVRRPSVSRTQSSSVLEVRKSGHLGDGLEALALAAPSTSSPNLSKIEEYPEPATIRRSSPLNLPSIATPHDQATPIPSPVEKTAPSTPRHGRSTIEFGRVSTSRIRTSSTASLLAISRPPSPPFASAHGNRPFSPGISRAVTPIPLETPPLLPLRARELFFASDESNRDDSLAPTSSTPPRHTSASSLPVDSPIPPTPDLVRSRPPLFRNSSSSPTHASLALHSSHELSRSRGRTLSVGGAHPSDSEVSWRSSTSTSEGEDTPASSAEQEDEDLSPREEAEEAQRLKRSDGIEGLWKAREGSEESRGLGEEGVKVW